MKTRKTSKRVFRDTVVVDGQEVGVGDSVWFKCDVEQCGKIVEIVRSSYGRTELVVEDEWGFSGGYIGGETRTTVDVRDCWL
jgi:hypothetical protein